MDPMPIQDEVINVKILMLSHIYNVMLNPTGRRIFGWNAAYKMAVVAYNAVVLTLVVVACSGYFVRREYFNTNTDHFNTSFCISHIFINFWRFGIVLNNSSSLWETLDVTKLTFCTSNACCKNIRTLYKYRNVTFYVANFAVVFTVALLVMWLMSPLTLVAFKSPADSTDIRKPNILNLPFPVRLETYNKYYALFYIIEWSIATYVTCYMIFFDSLFIIICMSMIAQYKVIARAFRYIGYEKTPPNGKTNQNTRIVNRRRLFSDCIALRNACRVLRTFQISFSRSPKTRIVSISCD